MPRCSASYCRNMGSHTFPKDPGLRKLWEQATNKENFKASKHSRLCSGHFKRSDYIDVCISTGMTPFHRYLKKTAVPSIFPCPNQDSKAIAATETEARTAIMHQCCVPGCRNIAYHSFPRDSKLSKLWEAAAKCRLRKHSKICSDHFKPEDYNDTGPYSGLVNTRRILKKGVVPSVFAWPETENWDSNEHTECNSSVDDVGIVKQEECVVLPQLKSQQLIESSPPKNNELKNNVDSPKNVPQEQESNSTENNKPFRDRSVRLRNKKAYLANRRCSVPHCNIRPSNEVSLHPCPNNAAVRNEWAEALRVSYQYVKNMVACSLHFMKIDFIQSKNAERVLKHNAVPSRNLPHRKRMVVPVKNKKEPVKKELSSKAFERQKTMTGILDETKEEQGVIRECRACLRKLDDKKSCCNVFQAWAPPWEGMEATIAEDLAKLANVEISTTDRHSKVLCAPCYQKLLDAATFASCVRTCDLLLRMRFTAEIDMQKVWPKPIQVDKNINGSVYSNSLDVEIKQEVLSDEEYPANGTDNAYVETELANLDIKIEPEEFVEPPPLNITINGTISLDPLNSENQDLTNGMASCQETQLEEITVKQEPMSEGEQEIEQVPDLPLECLLCTKSFNSVTGLKAHVIAQHSYKSVKRKSDGSFSPEKKRSDKHRCAICRRSFQTSTDLMVHETCHNKHACYGCTEKFDSFDLLTRHRNRCKASINNSVQKLKTLEDVKRPLPEDKVEQSLLGNKAPVSETIIRADDTEMKDLNSDQIKEDSDIENPTKTVDEEEYNVRAETIGEEIKSDINVENINVDIEIDMEAKHINDEEKIEVKSKQEVPEPESEHKELIKEEKEGESENKNTADPDSDMKLLLEIRSTTSGTEAALSDVDMTVETVNNEDCT